MEPTVILIDPDERREVLARRLRDQGFNVEVFGDPAAGANAALANPPDAVIADLWMPGISGVPLTRLLTSEPATMGVPVLLRATTDEPRNRFWARNAGAAAYVNKGRMGELVRALRRVIRQPKDSFFLQLGTVDVRDRIAAHLDRALFESVLASEVRALGSVGTFGRLLDLLSQLLVQITDYRWMAIRSGKTRLGLHCNPDGRELAIAEAKLFALPTPGEIDLQVVEDDDACKDHEGRPPLIAQILFGSVRYGAIAIAPTERSDADQALIDLVGRELGGALRMVDLVEETQRLAMYDPLTGLLRRAPFSEQINGWIRDGYPIALAIVDLDHFKFINDEFGHAGGDQVLSKAGALLSEIVRVTGGVAARWGGEEFVLGLPQATRDEAYVVAEEVRRRFRSLNIEWGGRPIQVSASIGVALHLADECSEQLIARADTALYAAKAAGRDRVIVASAPIEGSNSEPPLEIA